MTPAHCGAQKKRGGGTCRRPAGWGTGHPGQGHCKLHGGATPTHERAAERERAEEAVATYGLPLDVDPHTALLEEVHRTAGHVGWLRDHIAKLRHDHVTQGVTKTVQLPDGTRRVEATAAINVWVRLYQSERDRLVSVCKAAVAAGVAERQVEIAERHAQIMAEVFRRVFEDPELGLTPAQRDTAGAVTARHLRAIDGGKAA